MYRLKGCPPREKIACRININSPESKVGYMKIVLTSMKTYGDWVVECAAVINVVVDMTTCDLENGVTKQTSLSVTIISWSSSGVLGSGFSKSFSVVLRLIFVKGLTSDNDLGICGTGVFNSLSFPEGPGKGIPYKIQ